MGYDNGVPRKHAPMGLIADQMRSTLRTMAQSDARSLRALDSHLSSPRKLLNEMATDAQALPAGDTAITDAIALLEANGYTVTR